MQPALHKDLARITKKLHVAMEREKSLRAEQTALIKGALKSGMTMSEIGRLSGISKSRIWQIKNDYRRNNGS